VTPEARRWVARQLRWPTEASPNRLALVVPGSFHEQVGQRFVHRALAFSGTGNALLEHHKLVAYGSLAGRVEDIQLGDTVTVLITPIGIIAIAICKDFCDDHVGAVWHEIQPEWLLVPAYGPGERAHQAAAARIGRMVGTVTVLAHQGDASQSTPFRSFIHEAGKPSDTHGNSPDFREIRVVITPRKP
jgi:predicted amidohydrolase